MSARIQAWLLAAPIAVSLVACHRGTATQGVAKEQGESIGDTSAFRPRILQIVRSTNRVTYDLAAPAYVIMLAVVPGKSVEPVGEILVRTAEAQPGLHKVTLVPPREPASQPPMWTIDDQRDYDRCVAASRRALPKKKIVRTDSLGKQSVETTQEVEDVSRELEAERRCEQSINGRPRRVIPSTDDRYLVLLASSTPMTLVELLARLDATTATAEDVSSSISAIAEALYFDRKAIWSGYYARW